MTETTKMRRDSAHAIIVDNRDGSVERFYANGRNQHDARANAFKSAQLECAIRNGREEYTRFVALSWRAKRAVHAYFRG